MRGRRGRPGAVAAAPRHQGRVRPAGTGDVRAYRPVPPAAGRPAQRHAALAGHRRRAGAIGRGAVRDAAGGAHRAAGVREHVRAGILGRPGGRSRPRPGVRRADGGAGLDGGRRGHHRLRLVGRASRRGRRRRHRHAPCRPADQVPHPARHARRPAVLGRGGPGATWTRRAWPTGAPSSPAASLPRCPPTATSTSCRGSCTTGATAKPARSSAAAPKPPGPPAGCSSSSSWSPRTRPR